MHRSVCTDSEGLSGTACGCAGRPDAGDCRFFTVVFAAPLLYYRFTGEKETVDRYYGIADGILKHFSQYAREDGLLEQVADKWNLVDWPENLRDGYDFPLTRPVVALGCHNVINALYIGAMETQNTLAEICGREMPYQTKEIKKHTGTLLPGKDRTFSGQRDEQPRGTAFECLCDVLSFTARSGRRENTDVYETEGIFLRRDAELFCAACVRRTRTVRYGV